MAAADARPVPRKNSAWRLYLSFRKSDNTIVTSWTGADTKISLDGGAFADCTNELGEIGASGSGYIDFEAAEMNADAVVIKLSVTNAGAIEQRLTVYPEEAGDYRVTSSNSSVGSVSGAVGSVTGNVGGISGVTFPTNFAALAINASGHVSRVTLVDTTTTNSDMRGTDNAALAATALSTAVWTSTLATNLATTNSRIVGTLASGTHNPQSGDSFARLGAPSGASVSADIAAIATVTARLNTGLVQDGAVWQFTANMLELGPSGGAGGGDATLAKQEEILAAIDNYISTVVAGMELDTTTIVGFPSSLNIGDSYTDDMSADIHIFLRDSNDGPITSVGTHDVTDPDFAPELTIAQDGQVGRVKATVTWVTASPEGYLKVEIPTSQSRRAAPGVAQMQLVLKWDGAEKALTKQAVTWVARV